MEAMPLDEVFSRAGGKVAVARLLGLDASTPYSWTQVPGQHVIRLAAALDILPETLRPDMFDVRRCPPPGPQSAEAA